MTHDERFSIAGRKVQWICEFCHAMLFEDRLPNTWDWIYQSAVCPECRERVKADGGYHVVPAGAYAEGPDPRSEEFQRQAPPA